MLHPQAEYLSSPLLAEAGFRHAFFLRTGGASSGPYATLNFSYAVGDKPESVEENLARAAEALTLDPGRLFFLAQVHGRAVVEVDGTETHGDILATEGDALCGAKPDLACCVRTADCIPLLAADQATGRVVAIHAGWRGLTGNVIAHALARLGGTPTNWLVAIGPHISAEAFEISEDVASELGACSNATKPIIRIPGRRPHADLRSIARSQLTAAGLLPEHIDDIPGCTMTEADRFFSYRRDGRYSGRHLSAIVPQKR